MSPDPDRVPVPTNGFGAHPLDEAAPAGTLPPDQANLAFTPTQLAVGFGIIASLAILVAGWMRRRRRSGRR